MQENRGRWTIKMPSIGHDVLKMPSTGRDWCRQNILTPGNALRGEDLLLSVTCRKQFLVQGLVQI